MEKYNLKALVQAVGSPMSEDQVWALCFKTTKEMRLFCNEIRRQSMPMGLAYPIHIAKVKPNLGSMFFSRDSETFCLATEAVAVDMEKMKDQLVYDIGQLLLEAMRVTGREEFSPTSTLQALLLRMTGDATNRPSFKDILLACKKEVKLNANIHYDLVVKDMIFQYVYGDKLHPKTGIEDSGNTTAECDDTARDVSATLESSAFENMDMDGEKKQWKPSASVNSSETDVSVLELRGRHGGPNIAANNTNNNPAAGDTVMNVGMVVQEKINSSKDASINESMRENSSSNSDKGQVQHILNTKKDMSRSPGSGSVKEEETQQRGKSSDAGKCIFGRAISGAANYLSVSGWSKYLTRKGTDSSEQEQVESESTSDANIVDTQLQIQNVPEAPTTINNIINVRNWTGVVKTAAHIAALSGVVYCYRNKIINTRDVLHIAMFYGSSLINRPTLTIPAVSLLVAFEPYYLPDLEH